MGTPDSERSSPGEPAGLHHQQRKRVTSAKSSTLHKQIRSMPSLRSAWMRVSANGRLSTSKTTQDEVKKFSTTSESKLLSMQRRLKRGTYKFEDSRPIVTKKHTKPRPLLVASVQDRILQRAILDGLMRVPRVQALASHEFSFGTAQHGGVGAAVTAVTNAIGEGYQYFARSDIRQFFQRIVRDDVTNRLLPYVAPDVVSLFQAAIRSTFDERMIEPEYRSLFPDEETGVAQGSSLSSFAGNILLHGFDIEMNQRGIRCIRYADDFVLLAKHAKHVRLAAKSALQILTELKLEARDPYAANKNRSKADSGHVRDGFVFLGCQIRNREVSPTSAAKEVLYQKVKVLFQASEEVLRGRRVEKNPEDGIATVLRNVDQVIRAWGSAFAFCTDVKQMHQLDEKIDREVQAYVGRVFLLLKGIDPSAVRAALGIARVASRLR